MTNAPTAGCKLLQCVNAHTDKTLALEAGFVFHPSGVCLHEWDRICHSRGFEKKGTSQENCSRKRRLKNWVAASMSHTVAKSFQNNFSFFSTFSFWLLVKLNPRSRWFGPARLAAAAVTFFFVFFLPWLLPEKTEPPLPVLINSCPTNPPTVVPTWFR